MNDRDQTLFDMANTYRLHQDNLRWLLAGAHAAFLSATMTILAGDSVKDPLFLGMLTVAFFLAGTAFLLILGVENWYYNLFADYATDCEQRISQPEPQPLLTRSSFSEKHAEKVSPIHPSFIFTLSLLALGNTFYPIVFIAKAVPNRNMVWSIVFVVGYLLFAGLYFAYLRWLCKHWNERVFERWIKPYQHLWKEPPP
ncbi:MAG: hypothetical protein AB1696_27340 [Planctomycetota bacterium]